MALDCEIRVDGKDTGKGGNGRPKRSMTGPVSRFIRDSQFYYQAVFVHLRECGRCDPREALEGFLENRVRRQSGETSRTLVEMAERYRKKFPDRVSEELVRDFVTRCMGSHWDCFAKRAETLSSSDISRGVEVQLEAWRESIRKAAPVLRKALKTGRPYGPISIRGCYVELEPCSRLRETAEAAEAAGPRMDQLRGLLRRIGTPDDAAAGDEEVLFFLRTNRVWEVMTT